MKTPVEEANEWKVLGGEARDRLAKDIEARDAEWRRLVEEAQAERDKERAAHDFAADVLKTVQAERDRLKGELAEARRLAVIGQAAVDWATDTGECHFCHMDGAAHDIEVCPITATPAEQAQGEGAKRYVACAGTCGRRVMVYPGEDPVWHCGNAHCQIRTAAPDGHHRSSRGASMSCQQENYAEKVRMPADSDAPRHTSAPTGGLLDDVNAQVAALAKRVDELTDRLDRITSPPPRPFVSEVKRHWDDPAVRENFVDATLDDHEYRLRDLEWRFKTGGEKP